MKCAACEYEYRDGKTQLEKNVGQFSRIEGPNHEALGLIATNPGWALTGMSVRLYICPSCGTVRAE
jgi:hypothetical protein